MADYVKFAMSVAAFTWFAAMGFQTQAQSLLPTSLQVQNNSSTNRTLLSTNTTGVINPTPTSPLNAGQSDSFTSTSSGSSDAGVLQYSGCRFNWSKIRQSSGTFTFSRGASPSSSCSSTLISSNPTTGAYSLRFTIN